MAIFLVAGLAFTEKMKMDDGKIIIGNRDMMKDGEMGKGKIMEKKKMKKDCFSVTFKGNRGARFR
jgi:hypothetical protein